jgi:hypothetical protein
MSITNFSVLRLLGLCLMASGPTLARASESDVKADVRSDTDDAKRGVKKAAHRVDEAGCTGSKAECEKRKTTHRVDETKEHVSDKVHETSDRVKDETK